MIEEVVRKVLAEDRADVVRGHTATLEAGGWIIGVVGAGEWRDAVGDHRERQPRCTALLPVAQLLPAALTGAR
jgi:hypothetical protein